MITHSIEQSKRYHAAEVVACCLPRPVVLPGIGKKYSPGKLKHRSISQILCEKLFVYVKSSDESY
jgi:hypothetical protein